MCSHVLYISRIQYSANFNLWSGHPSGHCSSDFGPQEVYKVKPGCLLDFDNLRQHECIGIFDSVMHSFFMHF